MEKSGFANFIDAIGKLFKLAWRIKYLLLVFLVIAIFIQIILQNQRVVDISILLWSYNEVPLLKVVGITFVSGLILGACLVLLLSRRSHKKNASSPSAGSSVGGSDNKK